MLSTKDRVKIMETASFIFCKTTYQLLTIFQSQNYFRDQAEICIDYWFKMLLIDKILPPSITW